MSDIGVEKNSDLEVYPQDIFTKDPDLQMTLSKGLSTEIGPTNEISEREDEKPLIKDTKVSKRKLTEFGYLLQRKGFRLMRKYYKEKFEEFAKRFNYKKRVKVLSPQEINEIITAFAEMEFGSILPIFEEREFEELVKNLKTIILSDRSNKKEAMTQDIDFSIFKNLCAKYTNKKMKLFMQESTNSFLYTHFYLINGRLTCYEQKDVNQENFNTQMKKLVLESCQYLSSSVKPVYERLLINSRSLV
mmetsp:Transcript_6954/g.6128  ORF Transcript_6954/g.6128 Transcript_6954/m.6128 type:complete len:246 (-) Transcript_6954:108-845(-)